MIEAVEEGFTLAQCRRFYSEEIGVIAGVTSRPLVRAFSTVERERFMGPPPWQYNSHGSARLHGYRQTSEARDLYHDVFVALKGETQLNNGQPSMIARFLEALRLSPGKRVFHMGCGTGYYTAIMASVVGPEGRVTAVEVDAELADRARENLHPYPQAIVVHGDGGDIDPGPADAVLINAGVTRAREVWLDALAESGVLVLPLCVGATPDAKDAMVLAVTRRGVRFAAEAITVMTIYASPSMRNEQEQAALRASIQSRRIVQLRSVRRDEHEEAASCIVHLPGFCLSGETA